MAYNEGDEGVSTIFNFVVLFLLILFVTFLCLYPAQKDTTQYSEAQELVDENGGVKYLYTITLYNRYGAILSVWRVDDYDFYTNGTWVELGKGTHHRLMDMGERYLIIQRN